MISANYLQVRPRRGRREGAQVSKYAAETQPRRIASIVFRVSLLDDEITYHGGGGGELRDEGKRREEPVGCLDFGGEEGK